MSSHDQQEADERWIRGIDEDDRAPRDDDASAEPWPEVREEDVAKARRVLQVEPGCDEPTCGCSANRRILAVLEYARTHAQQAQETGR